MVEDIETSFQAAIDAGSIKGAIICATNTEHSFVYEKALGERTLLSGEKRTQRLDDIICLASATKLITTIAALQCVEDGLLTLTGDLSAIMPELGEKQVLRGFAADGEKPLFEAQERSITLEMLLTHSAGMSYWYSDPQIRRWREKFGSSRAEGRKVVEEYFDHPLSYQPGSGWKYGPGLDWAGRVVERVTGMTLSEWMQQRIFNPLSITDFEFLPVTREDLRARLVDLNPDDPEGLGRAVFGGKLTYDDTRGDFGGHGLFMMGTDYIKILHSLLTNDGKLLECATVDSMFLHRLSPEATAAHQAALNSPSGTVIRMGVAPETKVGFGLGALLTLEEAQGWYGKHTLTWGGGFTLAWFLDRENGLCAICAIQATLPLQQDVVNALKQNFRHDIYHKHVAWKNKLV